MTTLVIYSTEYLTPRVEVVVSVYVMAAYPCVLYRQEVRNFSVYTS